MLNTRCLNTRCLKYSPRCFLVCRQQRGKGPNKQQHGRSSLMPLKQRRTRAKTSGLQQKSKPIEWYDRSVSLLATRFFSLLALFSLFSLLSFGLSFSLFSLSSVLSLSLSFSLSSLCVFSLSLLTTLTILVVSHTGQEIRRSGGEARSVHQCSGA